MELVLWNTEKLVLTELTGIFTPSQIYWKANNVNLCAATDFTKFTNSSVIGWLGYGNNSTLRSLLIYLLIGCTSCQQNLILIDSQCYSVCPIQYYTQQNQQKIGCKRCNYQCKSGCSGPLIQDCYSIKYQYQIIFFISIVKFFIWCATSISGYILDKKQSRAQVEAPFINFIVGDRNDIQNDNQKFPQLQKDIQKFQQNDKEEKSSSKFKSESNSSQNQYDLEKQQHQLQMKLDLDKVKRTHIRRPRKKQHKLPFFDNQIQTLDFLIPSLAFNTYLGSNNKCQNEQAPTVNTIQNAQQQAVKKKEKQKQQDLIFNNIKLFSYWYTLINKSNYNIQEVFSFFSISRTSILTEKLVVQELISTFTSASVQWSSNAVSQCQTTDLTEFSGQSVMGFFGLGDNTSSKTFSNIPPHWSLSIRFDLILYQSLDTNQDYIYVKINGNTDTYVKQNPGGGYKTCFPSNIYGDELVLYYYNITHSSSSIGCVSCSSSLIFLNNSCLSECPHNYFTDQQQQMKECKKCHSYCKLGCKGPLEEDCDSIKYQYQIIFYILTGKSFIWVVSSLFGYFYDKKQSKIYTDTNFPPLSINSDKISNIFGQYQENNNNYQNEEKQQIQNPTDVGSQQNEKDQQAKQALTLQFQMKFDLDKMKRVGNRRPRQKFYKQSFYDKSEQIFECQLPYLNTNQPTFTKSISQFVPTQTNLINPSFLKDQKELNKRGVQVILPYIYKYKANQIFKFTILGNEWVSLFYFYDTEASRFIRATLIFLKYQAFFLSTEFVYESIQLLLIIALFASLAVKQIFKITQQLLVRKSFKFIAAIVFFFIAILGVHLYFWFLPELQSLKFLKDKTWSIYYGLLFTADFIIFQQLFSFIEYIFTIKYLNALYNGTERLVVQELIQTFTSASVQWSSNTVTQCQATDLTEFSNKSVMGFFGLGDTTSQKTFSNIPPHWSLSIRFDLILYQSLDPPDYIYVKINGNKDTFQKFNEQLVVQELIATFTSSSVQWSSNKVAQCQTTDITEFSNQNVMGFFGQGDTTSSKTFSNIPPHWSLSIRFDLILYQSLDWNDYIYVKINGNTDSFQKKNAGGGYKMCIPSNSYGDELVLYYYNITHSSSSISVTVQSLTDEAISNEGYGQQNDNQFNQDNNNIKNEDKSQIQNQTEVASYQNPQDQLSQQMQTLQFQMKFDLDKMKRVGNRRPRQKFYKYPFYDRSSQTFECQLPYLTTHQSNLTKSISQFVPTTNNLINPSYISNKNELNKRGVQVILPYIYKVIVHAILGLTEKLMIQELITNFTSSSVQWSSNTVTQCQQTDLTEFSNQSVMGIFGLGDTTSSKTFNDLPPHWSLSIRFDLLLSQTLDPIDFIYIKINENTDNYQKFIPTGGYKICTASSLYGDELVLYHYNTTHSSSSIGVQIKSLTDEPIKCPLNYFIDYKQQQTKGCKKCHNYCKLGCKGPLKEDCGSIQYKYQIILYIFIVKSFIWIISSLFGYFYDKKQSKVFIDTTAPPLSVQNKKNSQIFGLQNDDQIKYMDNNHNIKNEDKSQTQNPIEVAQFQNPQDQQIKQEQQTFQSQIKQDLDKMKCVGNRRPRQKFYKFYDKFSQILAYQQSFHQTYLNKSASQILPTTNNLTNNTNLSNQNELYKTTVQNMQPLPQIYKYQTNEKFKFTILGNEWVSLFYFYDTGATRFIRATLIFLKYQIFFLSTEYAYEMTQDQFKQLQAEELKKKNENGIIVFLKIKVETLVFQDLNSVFTSPGSQWNLNVVTQCQTTDFTEFSNQSAVGFFGISQSYSTKIYQPFPPHWSMSVRLDLILYQSLDPNDLIKVEMNTYKDGYTRETCCSGENICINNNTPYGDKLCLSSCAPNQISLKNSCVTDCPENYYSDQSQQIKECKECHSICKSGCIGPLKQDCDSIKYQYQIILYILCVKSLLWVISSIIGYIQDKKQSKVYNRIMDQPQAIESDRASQEYKDQIQFYKTDVQSSPSKTKMLQTFSQELQEQQQPNQEQITQVETKLNINTKTNVKRRPRKLTHKNIFYQKSLQTELGSQINIQPNMQSIIKSTSLFTPNASNMAGTLHTKDQKEQHTQNTINLEPKKESYAAVNILRFTILGNEWISLFYFYNNVNSRVIRATLIFLKYQAFFLSTEFIQENQYPSILLWIALLFSIMIKQALNILQSILVQKHFRLITVIIFFFMVVLTIQAYFWFLPQIQSLKYLKDVTWSFYYGLVFASDILILQQLLSFFDDKFSGVSSYYKLSNQIKLYSVYILNFRHKSFVGLAKERNYQNIMSIFDILCFWLIILINTAFGAEKLIVQELNQQFTSATVQWSNTVTLCTATDFTEFSNQSVMGIYAMGQVSGKYFQNIPPHWSLSVRLDLVLYLTLDPNDQIQVQLNNIYEGYTKDAYFNGNKLCFSTNTFGDELVLFYRNITHSDPSITINVCLSCAPNNFFLNNNCYQDCPENYYAHQQDQKCNQCHNHCKQGCNGPLQEDCSSIKYQYQVILYILISKTFIWIVSSIVGYIQDKKQSKVLNQINNSPNTIDSDKASKEIRDNSQIQFGKTDFQQSPNRTKLLQTFSQELQEEQQQPNITQVDQIQTNLNLNKNNIQKRRPRKLTHKNTIYLQSINSQIHLQSSLPQMLKSTNQVSPTVSSLINKDQKNQESLDDQIKQQKDEKYKDDKKFKFTILGNEWVSLFYFYDTVDTRVSRATLIFLKYSVFFLTTEFIYQNQYSYLFLSVALLLSLILKQFFKVLQSYLARKHFRLISVILLLFIAISTIEAYFWFVPELQSLKYLKDQTWSLYYGIVFLSDFVIVQQILSFFEYFFTVKYLNAMENKKRFVNFYKFLLNEHFIAKLK
ncbi:hypothetical protein ABPG74_005112 [Tetrahymena malaccensis]